jgi:Putative TM nitroreductase
MKTFDFIQKRVSVRTYTHQEVDEKTRAALLDYAATLKAPWGNRARFTWVPVQNTTAGQASKVGTYGTVQGARLFLAGSIPKAPGAVEDFGYLFEAVLLKATEWGLGTCWLGGTFDRSDFKVRVNLQADELIPAISPVGFSANKSLQERLIGGLMGVRKRLPLRDWAILNGDPGVYRDAIEAVRLGPSASNKQPWRLFLGQDGVAHFYIEETPGYNSASVDRCGFPIQSLDMGIAFFHWQTVLRDEGIFGTWSRKDPVLTVPAKWVYVATWSR